MRSDRVCRYLLAAHDCALFSRIGFQLPLRDIGFDQYTAVISSERDSLASSQPRVPSRLFVVAFGIGKGLGCPGERGNPVADRPDQHVWTCQTRQVQVGGKVLHDLPHSHMVAPPERYPVQVGAQDRRAQAVQEQFLALELPSSPDSQSIGSGQAERLPCHRGLRHLLHGNQQPAVGFWQSGIHCLIGSAVLRFGLPDLER